MDKTLERILNLIPKKPDGSFVHGAKKAFAESIGFKGGEVVTMWINGSSVSYRNKLHEIAAVYSVSVDWLKGTSDEKDPPPMVGSGNEKIDEIIRIASGLSSEDVEKLIAYAEGIRDAGKGGRE